MAATLHIWCDSVRETARHWVDIAPIGTVVRFEKPRRTLSQNAKMWVMLTEIAKQAEHNGRKYSPENWKLLFMHACGHEVQFITGLSGEPFPAGFRSSKLNKEHMSELIEFMHFWAANNGVTFDEA